MNMVPGALLFLPLAFPALTEPFGSQIPKMRRRTFLGGNFLIDVAPSRMHLSPSLDGSFLPLSEETSHRVKRLGEFRV